MQNPTMQYQNFDGNEKKKPWMTWALGITGLLCLVSTCLMIYFAASNGGSSSSSSSSTYTMTNATCTTAACVSLADDVLSSIDSTADPCEDFFAYACGNWVDDNDWELVEDPSYSQFSVLANFEMETFLDALYYDTDASLVNHSSVEKAIAFYSSCYASDVSEEDITTSSLLQTFIKKVNFTGAAGASAVWDDDTRQGFTDAVSWLSARSWNYLFVTGLVSSVYPQFYQNYGIWPDYNSSSYAEAVTSTYVPLYESVFGLNSTAAAAMGTKVVALADSIAAVTTATADWDLATMIQNGEVAVASPGNMSEIFGTSALLNLTKIIFDTYDYNKFEAIIYYKSGVSFFTSLATILEDASPEVVQYLLFTDVFTYSLNYESSYEQSRLESRVEFCYTQELAQFPFVYGYILYNQLFSDSKYASIYNLVQNISANGIRVGINDAAWIEDDASLDESVKKIDNLGIYVGLPPSIGDYSSLDSYYAALSQDSSGFLDNLGALLDFAVAVQQQTLAGTLFDLIAPWPSIFSDASSYESWLTGINAFYVPSGNFFTIPVTISQEPYFSEDYPSAINFGGLGSVVGHEISHGFDPDGSYYNWNGTNVDIWSADTRAAYTETTDCFVTQYDGLEISDGEYVNGSRTITENVADNGGVTASYYAWRTFVEDNGDDATLPGVDMTSTQLFYWAWAHAWCEAYRPGYYDGWSDVHAPNPARVWGVVQNSDEFADAYSCKSGSAMNPKSKCTLW